MFYETTKVPVVGWGRPSEHERRDDHDDFGEQLSRAKEKKANTIPDEMRTMRNDGDRKEKGSIEKYVL